MNTQKSYDLVIIGASLVGASLALALRHTQLKIAIVEHATWQSLQNKSDSRALVLTQGSKILLEKLGIWPELAAQSNPILQVIVSEPGCFKKVRLNLDNSVLPAFGYVINFAVLQQVLLKNLAALNIDCYFGQSLTAVDMLAEQVRIQLSFEQNDQQELSAKLLVGADGGNSQVKKLAGISANITDYEQVAIIGNLTHSLPHNFTAYERFSRLGPLAILPLKDLKQSALVWALPKALSAQYYQLPSAEFLAKLQENFGFSLGKFTNFSHQSNFPLKKIVADKLFMQRAVLLGNSANNLHPIAAQGFNLGLRDAWQLADLLAGNAQIANDSADPNLLSNYAYLRRQDHQTINFGINSLLKLFGDHKLLNIWLRHQGLLGFDLFPGVRDLLMRKSMGIS